MLQLSSFLMISASRRCSRAGAAMPRYGNSWCRFSPKILQGWPLRENPSVRNTASRNPIRRLSAWRAPGGADTVTRTV